MVSDTSNDHTNNYLHLHTKHKRGLGPPRVQCAHNICTVLSSSHLSTNGVRGGPTVQLGHTICVSWSLARPSYLHNRHKWVRVRWFEAVALLAPFRLVVPMDWTPELDNSTIHRNGAHTMRQHASSRSLPAIFLRSHYIKRGNT